MGIVSDGSYGVAPGLIFSYPVVCKNFSWEIVQGLTIDENSQQKLNITLKELEDEQKDSQSVL